MRGKLLATAAVVALSMPAFAAEYGVKTGAGTTATTSGSATMGSGDLNFGKAVSAMNNAKATADKIEALTNVDAVIIVDVSTLAKGQNDAALSNAMSRNQGDVATLKDAIEQNAEVMAAIKAKDAEFDVSTVVAADVAADGQLVIFTQG